MNEFHLTYSASMLIAINYSENLKLLLICSINHHQIIMTIYINKTSMNYVFQERNIFVI